MALELHVWGGAFELASIDAECLATITYFVTAKPESDWKLVESSPSAVPTRVSQYLNPPPKIQAHQFQALFPPSTTHNAARTDGYRALSP
jgi:hypothetical protein